VRVGQRRAERWWHPVVEATIIVISGGTMSADTSHRVPTQHRVAAVLSVAYAVFSIVWSLPVISGGSHDNKSSVPWGVIIVGFVIAVVICVAAYGVWTGQRWGVVLTVVMNALSFILGAPGIIFGDSAFLVVSSIIGCLANVAVIVLLLRRSRATSAAPTQQSSEGVPA
jgi:hypothetical protein